MAYAIDYRTAYIGSSIMVPVELGPDARSVDPVYSMDMAYFFAEQWAATLSWDFGLRDDRVVLAVGPQFFLLLDRKLTPYFTTKFLYQVNGGKDPGWRVTLGAEWNMVDITKMDNFRLYAETGMSQLFLDNGQQLSRLEILRLGFAWSF